MNIFTKFRNKLPDVSGLAVGLLFIVLIPVLLISLLLQSLFPSREFERFKLDYLEFLKAHDGEVFFCYTNRKNSVDIVEKYILPELDKSINVIKLNNKIPHTKLNERYISYALSHLKNVGFPNVMKISNEEMLDHSMHNQVYNAINQGKLSKLIQITQGGLVRLKGA